MNKRVRKLFSLVKCYLLQIASAKQNTPPKGEKSSVSSDVVHGILISLDISVYVKINYEYGNNFKQSLSQTEDTSGLIMNF